MELLFLRKLLGFFCFYFCWFFFSKNHGEMKEGKTHFLEVVRSLAYRTLSRDFLIWYFPVPRNCNFSASLPVESMAIHSDVSQNAFSRPAFSGTYQKSASGLTTDSKYQGRIWNSAFYFYVFLQECSKVMSSSGQRPWSSHSESYSHHRQQVS